MPVTNDGGGAFRALVLLALLTVLTLTMLSPAQAAQAAKGKSSISILTFNVCGHAAGCGSWQKRETAVVNRIVASKADVVNIQEGWGVLASLELRLAGHGYIAVASSGNEGIFAKARTMSPVETTETVTSCTKGPIYLGPEVDTSEWNVLRPHKDESGFTWYHDGDLGVWFRIGTTCADVLVPTTKNGEIGLGGRASSTWAMLQVKRTKKTYLFVSAHLTTGKDKVARKRSKETTRLLSESALVAEGRPRIFAGDFNSSVQRRKDTVGKRFREAGFSDGFTKATSRSGTKKYNSATGYGKRPRVGGSHIDRVFLPRGATASKWSMAVKLRGRKSVRPIPSDHSSVRVSVVLP